MWDKLAVGDKIKHQVTGRVYIVSNIEEDEDEEGGMTMVTSALPDGSEKDRHTLSHYTYLGPRFKRNLPVWW